MAGIDLDVRTYEQVEDMTAFVSKIVDYLEDYNSSAK